ncbi:MAG: hypothetical protein SFX73_30690 [Kofleriaceae bacterium]|nr:hypothetical protein [Kofleriaceae bacterium]
MANRRSWNLSHVAIILYLVSLVLPAITVIDRPLFGSGSTTRVWFGAQCLAMGWIVWPGWLANPLFALALILRRFEQHGAAAVLLVFAIASALLGLFILRDIDLVELRHVQIGYVVWLASLVVLLIAAVSPPRFNAMLEP